MPKARHFILGTAGHIDHGKSSLVRALTGTDPDRLPEEKARGMTIELGFAHLAIADPEIPDTTYEIGLVDVPGHADFVRNMVAGVGALDAALLVVAADDSWMPQTEEHVQILDYLGVRRGVVALTKADLAEDIGFVAEDVGTYLEGTGFETLPLVPVSSVTGAGLDELRQALAACFRECEPSPDFGKPRLPVDRAFSLTGRGTIVTGTLTGGSLSQGTQVVVYPAGHASRVRSIESHNRALDTVPPGSRTALGLSDVAVATRSGREGVYRGDLVTLPSLGEPSLAVDVWLRKSGREVPGQPRALRPLRHGQKVRFHHGSSDTAAKVYFSEGRRLEPGEEAVAELRFETPVFAFAGDRFVLRDWSKLGTLAGGAVLDPEAQPRRFRKPAQRAFLETMAVDPTDADAYLGARLGRDGTAPAASVFGRFPCSAATAEGALDTAFASGHVLRMGPFAVDAGWWREKTETAASTIRQHHRDEPERTALSFAALRNRLPWKLSPAQFDLLVTDLTDAGFVRTPKGIRAAGHLPSLPPDLEPVRREIMAALESNPFEPPNPKEVVTSEAHRKVFRFLVDTGQVADLGDKCAITAESLARLEAIILDEVAHAPKTVADLRDSTGSTRRILLPVLENLDRRGATVRNGDFRTRGT